MTLSGLVAKLSDKLLRDNPEYKEKRTIEYLKQLYAQNACYIGIGLPEITQEGFFISYYIFTPLGNLVLIYRKNYLYGSDYHWAKSGNNNYPILKTKFGNIGFLICHDITFKESVNAYFDNNVNFLIVGTN